MEPYNKLAISSLGSVVQKRITKYQLIWHSDIQTLKGQDIVLSMFHVSSRNLIIIYSLHCI